MLSRARADGRCRLLLGATGLVDLRQALAVRQRLEPVPLGERVDDRVEGGTAALALLQRAGIELGAAILLDHEAGIGTIAHRDPVDLARVWVLGADVLHSTALNPDLRIHRARDVLHGACVLRHHRQLERILAGLRDPKERVGQLASLRSAHVEPTRLRRRPVGQGVVRGLPVATALRTELRWLRTAAGGRRRRRRGLLGIPVEIDHPARRACDPLAVVLAVEVHRWGSALLGGVLLRAHADPARGQPLVQLCACFLVGLLRAQLRRLHQRCADGRFALLRLPATPRRDLLPHAASTAQLRACRQGWRDRRAGRWQRLSYFRAARCARGLECTGGQIHALNRSRRGRVHDAQRGFAGLRTLHVQTAQRGPLGQPTQPFVGRGIDRDQIAVTGAVLDCARKLRPRTGDAAQHKTARARLGRPLGQIDVAAGEPRAEVGRDLRAVLLSSLAECLCCTGANSAPRTRSARSGQHVVDRVQSEARRRAGSQRPESTGQLGDAVDAVRTQ